MIKKNFKRMAGWASILIAVFLLMGITSACNPVYVPTTVNVPLLGEKGQANVAATAGISGIDLQGAYAFSKQMAGMVNLSYLAKDKNNYNNHFFIEGGIGYFLKLGKSGRFDCYGGYGWGQAEATTNNDTLHPKSDYHRFFIQPSIGVVTDHFDGAFSLRVVHVNFYNTVHFSGQSKLFFEPVLTGKFGSKALRFVSQFGLSLPTSKIIELEDSFEPIILSLGLQYNLRKNH
jgi:hypothetical protein